MEMGRGLGLEIFATKGGRGKAKWGVCLEMGNCLIEVFQEIPHDAA